MIAKRYGCKRLLLLALVVAFWIMAPDCKAAADEGVSAKATKAESTPAEVKPAKEPLNVAAEYKVGEGDVLQIAVWKEPELSQTVKVRPDGNISLPLVSEVRVSGRTTSEIQQILTTKLKTFLVDPQVNIQVAEIHSRQVFITGEIARPGIYPLTTPTTVLQLIAQAGGFSPFAKRKNIVILRKQDDGQQVRLPFNYKEVVRGRNSEENILLQPGDTVVVP